jgi:AAA15 family ATPase/GTPase
MIQEITVSNFKSILSDSIQLGNINVLIGENGSGKTNYLEAIGMLSAAVDMNFDNNGLWTRGIRVTKPALTMSSFLGTKPKRNVEVGIHLEGEDEARQISFSPENEGDIYTKWVAQSITDDAWEALVEGKFQIRFAPIVANTIEEQRNREEGIITVNDLTSKVMQKAHHFLTQYAIFNLDTQSLRGVSSSSLKTPLGIYGEGLDILLNDFSKEEWEELLQYSHLISWLEEIVIDKGDKLKFKGHKLGRSNSILYFRDKYMRKNNNVFAAENSNEGVLHVLFYLALFISKKTPKFFAIDNIETALNPRLCRTLIKELAALSVKHGKQVLITTHNPAILDGLNLHDDKQRLFVVRRTDDGHTKSTRIKLKPEVEGKDLKLSEMWMRGYLGGLPTNF